MYKNYFLPIGLLAGTIIGAGIFSLPFVFKAAGLGVGFFYLALAAFVYVTVHLMYADIVLRTAGEHRFVGYAERYLGRGAYWFAIVSTVVSAVFVLTIYLVLALSFADLLAANGPDLYKIGLFWILGSAGIFLSLRELASLEFWITGGIAAIIALIFGLGIIDSPQLMFGDFKPNLENVLLPLAPILFALSGRVAIPALVDYFKHPQGVAGVVILKKVIEWGTVLPAVVYAGFVLGVVALSPVVSPDAVSGLSAVVSPIVMFIIGVLGILSLFSSYIVVGLDVYNILRYDLKFIWLTRVLVVVGGPMAIYLSGFKDFIELVSFTGGIFLAIEGLFVVFMWQRAARMAVMPTVMFEKHRRWLPALIILVFAAALLYEIIK